MAGGRYELLEFVSKGGMGAVYRARDVELDRWVAVKCLLDVAGHDARELAIREARTLASLRHPNIMRVYDILTAGDQVWIISEWLEGRCLAQLRPPLPPGHVLAIMAQVFDALAAAHAAQIIHRDIKPSNVMIGPDGRVTLIDFGVAYAPGVSTGETMVGSLRYTDPRILEGRPPDGLSDLFSSALLMIELMTGETVLPDLAPLPLYRHIKRNLNSRIDRLLDGAYPPLAAMARKLTTGRESLLAEAAVSPAREQALLAQDHLRRLTARLPEAYLAEGLCRGVFVDPDAERAILEETEEALASRVLSPRQKAAWLAFKRTIVPEETPSEPEPVLERRPARQMGWLLPTLGLNVVLLLALLFGPTWSNWPGLKVAREWLEIGESATAERESREPLTENRVLAEPTPIAAAPQGDVPRLPGDQGITADPPKELVMDDRGVLAEASVAKEPTASTQSKKPAPKASPRAKVEKEPVVAAKADRKTRANDDNRAGEPVESTKLATAKALQEFEPFAPIAMADGPLQSRLDDEPRLSLPLSQEEIGALIAPEAGKTPLYLVANTWADVFIDGVLFGRLPKDEPFYLEPGEHVVRLENPTVEPVELTVRLADEPRKFRFALKVKVVPRTIRLTVPGQLFVNGVDYGIVQEKTLPMAFGTHEVWVKRGDKIIKPLNVTIGPETPEVIVIDTGDPTGEAH